MKGLLLIWITLMMVCVCLPIESEGCYRPSNVYHDVHAQVIDMEEKESVNGDYTIVYYELRILGEYKEEYTESYEVQDSVDFWDTITVSKGPYEDNPEDIQKGDFVIVSFSVYSSDQDEGSIIEIRESHNSYSVGVTFLLVPLLYFILYHYSSNRGSYSKGAINGFMKKKAYWIHNLIWFPFIVLLFMYENVMLVRFFQDGALIFLGLAVMIFCVFTTLRWERNANMTKA